MKKIELLFGLILTLVLTTSCMEYGLATYQVTSLSNGVVKNNDMSVEYDKFITTYKPDGSLLVTNNADSTMYIDLGESYVLDRNGQAQRIFTNSVTTNTTSGTSGASVNLGAVAGALGVGGTLGTLARGVNVGGATTKGSSVQIFEERYILIPAHTSMNVKFTMIDTPYMIKLKKGTSKSYEINDSPLVIGNVLSYTFNSNGKNIQSVRNYMYVSNMTRIGNHNKTVRKIDEEKTNNKVIIYRYNDTKLELWTTGIIVGACLLYLGCNGVF